MSFACYVQDIACPRLKSFCVSMLLHLTSWEFCLDNAASSSELDSSCQEEEP